MRNRELRDQSNRFPDGRGIATGIGVGVQPRTPAEQLVAQLWKTTLQVSDVRLVDDFFDVGGNSLRAMQLTYRLVDAFQTELPLRTVFDVPTIEGIVSAIARRLGDRDMLDRRAAKLLEGDPV